MFMNAHDAATVSWSLYGLTHLAPEEQTDGSSIDTLNQATKTLLRQVTRASSLPPDRTVSLRKLSVSSFAKNYPLSVEPKRFVTVFLTVPTSQPTLSWLKPPHSLTWYNLRSTLILWRVGGYASQIRWVLRRMIGFISVSYTRTLNYTQVQAVPALSLIYTVYNPPLLTH
jgi:hypothetical protein